MYIFVLMKIKDSIPKRPGVYMLRSKTDLELFYIGSTENLNQRYCRHRHSGSSCKNRNPNLINHLKKYGKDDFDFIVLELCDIQFLSRREQYYISELNPSYNIFNFCGRANNENKLARKIAFRDIGESSNNYYLKYRLFQYINKELPEIIIPLNYENRL